MCKKLYDVDIIFLLQENFIKCRVPVNIMDAPSTSNIYY